LFETVVEKVVDIDVHYFEEFGVGVGVIVL